MKKIALILCLVLVASFVLSGCNNSDSIITLEDREQKFLETVVRLPLLAPGRAQKHFHTASPEGAAV